MHHYTTQGLVDALHSVGLKRGDVVFSHVGMGMLGYPDTGRTEADAYKAIRDAFLEVLGPEGTWLVPTYSYSFCKREVYNPQTTPSTVGPFTERFRQEPNVQRSLDPIFSVAGCGPHVEALFRELPHDCFGEDCIYQRLQKLGAKICNVGVGFKYATFVHHVEQSIGVPYRYLKLFTGLVETAGTEGKKQGWLYNVRILAGNSEPDLSRLEKEARAQNLLKEQRVGFGIVSCTDLQSLYKLASAGIARDPWFLAKGPAGNPLELETARVGNPPIQIQLQPNASTTDLLQALWKLPRDIVSDGYDAALQALARQIPMQIHEYPTGTQCWTWIVPEKWSCQEAYLETMSGRRLFSYADNPLHVVSYSLPFEGEISREELLKHLYVHWKLPDAIPFQFRHYERDWGLCCSQQLRDSLTDDKYRVVIKSHFSLGTLKVGEVVVPGKSDDCIVLCAHLCHPAMANDDLAGVLVGLDVMRQLRERPTLRFTYRLLLLPETIGSLAYLSHHEELIPKMKGGLFLEMLGLNNPHALQLSFAGDTEIDRCFTAVLQQHDPKGWTGPFGKIVGNDERQFNAPGARVPMLSLSRVLKLNDPDWPYPEYHSSHDTPERVSTQSLQESSRLVLHMIDALESNRVPVNRFKGEIFCSRYGIHVDFRADPKGRQALFDIMYLIDGTRSITGIAAHCGVPIATVQAVTDELVRHGLVEYR